MTCVSSMFDKDGISQEAAIELNLHLQTEDAPLTSTKKPDWAGLFILSSPATTIFRPAAVFSSIHLPSTPTPADGFPPPPTSDFLNLPSWKW